jgi:DNA-binding CsgD family transcriptional regulator
MPPTKRPTTRGEREALGSIRRACYSGLDALTLRQEVARHAAAVLPADACAIMCTDPETGLFTHGWGEHLSESFVRSYLTGIYPTHVTQFVELAESGVLASTESSGEFLQVLRTEGLKHAVHTALSDHGEMFGTWCLFREAGSRPFGERETRFLRAVAPHLACGLRAAALAAAALDPPGSPDPAALPGVLVLDHRHRIVLRSGGATRQLQDLADDGVPHDLLPYAIASLLTRLAAAVGDPSGVPSAELCVPGRSGRHYLLRATLAEPDADGNAATTVVIEPRVRRDPLPLLAQRYGLSPRERQVIGHLFRGESNKRIAAGMGLSIHTVQDHLDRACAKVGARGRRALLAKLYTDAGGLVM